MLAFASATGVAFSLIPRRYPNMYWTVLVFAFSNFTIELAWLLLALQIISAFVLILFGALFSPIGILAMWILIICWPVLAWHFFRAFKTDRQLEVALREALGDNYQQAIPQARRALFKSTITFDDWKNPISFSDDGIEIIRNIPYDNGGIRQTLDIYRPAGDTRKNIPDAGSPVLLQIHGGAWIIGDKSHQGLPLMHLMARRGWTCVAINYRLSPSVGYPKHLHDCKKALDWIKTHGGEYGMDTNFVATTGGSAGGHLTALMGLTANNPSLQPDDIKVDTRVQACVPLFGAFDLFTRYNPAVRGKETQKFLEQQIMHSLPDEEPEAWQNYSPVDQAGPHAPPFFIIHGTRDSIIPIEESSAFALTLENKSTNPVAFAKLIGADHAFELIHSPRTELTIAAIHRFLEWAYAQHRTDIHSI